ncbi:hypothetical protein EU546_01735 [Candidatus Thorarchaeota archaeon]|nr:MAG: hypothetical protein EU546_01735 [Candidatus Thorarchaeota archaeon]
MGVLSNRNIALGLMVMVLILSSTTNTEHIGKSAQDFRPEGEVASRCINHDDVNVTPFALSSRMGFEGGETVGIVIADSVYPSIVGGLGRYEGDLEGSGYQTVVHSDHLQTHQQLKSLIVNWSQLYSLAGVVLIGRLPYAEFYQPPSPYFDAEVFICDLYLMDLDGSWWDLDSDGIFDKHNASLGADIHPEIFVGRIDPTCLTWVENPSEQINGYLDKLHAYRTGDVQRSDRALSYIDDDWSTPWGSMWNLEIGLAYSNRTLVNEPQMTKASGWLNYLAEDYQWAHLCAHSSPTTHYFGPGGVGQGTVSSSEIHDVPPTISFYNLFCCSGAEWTVSDNLAVTYAFSGEHSLAAIGSSKTGSMMDLEFFYEPLGQNETLGKSLVEWFCESLDSDGEAGQDFLHWYYGMNIVGDPTLAIEYDCTAVSPQISSPTHPDPIQWYGNRFPVFEWSEPPEVNDITGYYYTINQECDTNPTAGEATFTTATSIQPDSPLPEGSWFIHVITEDSIGNRASEASHYRVNIDHTPPTVAVTSHPSIAKTPLDTIALEWSAQDLLSGYNHSQVWIDEPTNLLYEGVNQTVAIDDLLEGEHTINVTVFDRAGNTASALLRLLVDLTDPSIASVQPTDGSLVGSTVSVSWTVDESGSGYSHCMLILDDEEPYRVDAPQTSLLLANLDMGEHVVKLMVYDRVNRSHTVSLTLHAHPIMDIPWTFFVAVGAVIAVGALWIRSRGD